MCVNCGSNILNEALATLDTMISEHGEYNLLFILNDYYEDKYKDSFYAPKSHVAWCASLLGQPESTPECDCSSLQPPKSPK